MLFAYWYMFFACLMIAAVAMTAGIGGATFFVPFVLLVLHVPVSSAVAIGIFVEIFGFSAGVYNYSRAKKIDYPMAGKLIASAALFVVLGAVLNRTIKPTVVEYILILALMIFATQILLAKDIVIGERPKKFDAMGASIAALGGLLLGFISSGLGEANEYNLLVRFRREPAVVAGTSVLVVAVCAVLATAVQVFFITRSGGFGTIAPYTMLIAYSILGAIAGAKVGQLVAERVDRKRFRMFVSVLLYFVAASTLAKVLLIH